MTPEQEIVFDTQRRLDAVQKLRTALDVAQEPVSPESLTTSPLTIGIEVEMTWRQAFPELSLRYPESPRNLSPTSVEYALFAQAYSEADQQLRPRLTAVLPFIPKVGYDAYWEFSFLPTRTPLITGLELKALYDADILHNNKSYAMHMTVAGIVNDRDAFAFLCGLELNGGTQPERLIQAAHSEKGAWSRKGNGGILARQPHELLGDDTTGYEFRTLAATSFEQALATLQCAQDLATLFCDKEAWIPYRKHIEEMLTTHSLELQPWKKPKDDPLPWMHYIELLTGQAQ